MNSPVDVSPNHLDTVLDILYKHLPADVKVWVFGSRADWTTKDSSDLDLALEGDSTLDYGTIMALETAFEESSLPYKVDVIDINQISDNFRKIVDAQKVHLPAVCFNMNGRGERDSVTGTSDTIRVYKEKTLWRKIPFNEAILLNPKVSLQRGATYPYVDMATINPNSRLTRATMRRQFQGSGSKFREGDTLMARITPCLENGKITRYRGYKNGQVAHGSTEFIVIRGRSGVTDNDFVYYLAQWDGVRNYAIGQMTGTSGRQRVPLDSLNRLVVFLPPLDEQRYIAHVLGTLDDKIELNLRMSQTLEEMAWVLFKSWFVDFDPVRAKMEGRWKSGESLLGLPAEFYSIFPDRLVNSDLGEIPEGWVVKALDEIATFLNGLALQKYPANGGPSLPVIKITQLRSGNVHRADMASRNIPMQYQIHDGDVLFSWSGSLVLDIWTGGEGALNQHLFKVESVDYPKWLYYHSIRQHLADFRDIASDKATTMGHIQRHHIHEAKIAIPNNLTLELMSKHLQPILDRSQSLRIASRTLVAQRDELLPKLVSGKIRVRTLTERAA